MWVFIPHTAFNSSRVLCPLSILFKMALSERRRFKMFVARMRVDPSGVYAQVKLLARIAEIEREQMDRQSTKVRECRRLFEACEAKYRELDDLFVWSATGTFDRLAELLVLKTDAKEHRDMLKKQEQILNHFKVRFLQARDALLKDFFPLRYLSANVEESSGSYVQDVKTVFKDLNTVMGPEGAGQDSAAWRTVVDGSRYKRFELWQVNLKRTPLNRIGDGTAGEYVTEFGVPIPEIKRPQALAPTDVPPLLESVKMESAPRIPARMKTSGYAPRGRFTPRMSTGGWSGRPSTLLSEPEPEPEPSASASVPTSVAFVACNADGAVSEE